MHLSEITNALEIFAPLAFQESYDNAGLYCGDPSSSVEKVLICLDITEQTIEEAIAQNCQLILAHHPVIFKPIKRLVGDTYVERIMLKAIQHNIALYAAHTNLDTVQKGVNGMLSKKLGLENVSVLDPKKESLCKLVVFVPMENTASVLEAMNKAGAGQIGNYKNCSFRVEGTGTFMPSEGSEPYLGQKEMQEEVNENRIEVLFPHYVTNKVLIAMKKAHPYEEVAYYLQTISNLNQEAGAGAIGELKERMHVHVFLSHLKSALKLDTIRYTPFSGTIKRVAVCGGSGSFLLKKAISLGADAFVSADFKYHEFFDGEGKILIADVGHYESEFYTKELLMELLKERFPNLELLLCETNTNPIRFYS